MPHTVFTSDSAAIERVLQRLEEQNAKLIQQNRMLARTSRESSREVKSVFKEQAEGLLQMGVGFVSIERGISAVTKAYTDWENRLRSLGKTSVELSQNLTRDIAGAGDLPRAAAVEAFIESQQLGTQEQARQAYAGVSGGTPATPLDDRLALSREALRAAPIVEDLRSYGRLLGELRDVLPRMSAEDVSDLAMSLRERAGAEADKLTSDSFLRSVQGLVESGAIKSPAQGFAFGLTAMNQNLKPEVIEQLTAAVTGTFDLRRPQPGKFFSPEDRAYNRFAVAGAEERLQMLLTDRAAASAVLGRDTSTKLRLLDPAEIERTARELQADIARDFTGERLRQLEQTRGGAKVSAEHELAVEADQASRYLEGRGEAINRADKFFEMQADREKSGWFTRMLRKFGYELTYFTNNLPLIGTDRPEESAIEAQRWIPEEERRRFLDRERAIRGEIRSGGAIGAGTPGDLQSILQQRGQRLPMRDPQMDEQTQVLRSIERSLAPGPRVAPVINAHTETR